MENKNKRNSVLAALTWLLIPLLIIVAMYFTFNMNDKTTKDEYYQIVQYFDEDKVTEYNLNMSSGKLTYVLAGEKEARTYMVPNVNLFVSDVHDTVREYNKEHPDSPVEMNYEAGASTTWLYQLLPVALSSIILIAVLFWAMKKMNNSMLGDAGRTLNFGKARIKSGSDEERKTTFDDVAGADEEKEDLMEIVEFLKNPQKFNDLGARIPKGVLLVGPPGTGKTLLARAVAGEANAPFFSISGSDFVEMYVGVGASRVRDLFETAKKNAPAIIFIDEIDAVGRHRGAGMGGGHDEREQTLNQLLVEMDGFGANVGIIIIAATNRPDILDPALLRPGRFDRQITVNYPDVQGREDILKVHAKNKPIGPDVSLNEIARATAGFTGADLENLLNESALLAARRGKKAITKREIEESTIKVVVGTEKKSKKISDKEKKLTAYHEAGHAVTNYYLDDLDPVHQISIIPRGMAGGYTMSMPTEDKSYTSKKNMLDELVTLLGGRVSEAIILGDISTGASNDIERATNIARKMITKYGMSEKLGPIAYGNDNDEVFLGKDYNHMRNYSEDTAAAIDKEIANLVTDAYDRADEILRMHIDQLHKLADFLQRFEKIDGDLFKTLMSDESFSVDEYEKEQNEKKKQKEEEEKKKRDEANDAKFEEIRQFIDEQQSKDGKGQNVDIKIDDDTEVKAEEPEKVEDTPVVEESKIDDGETLTEAEKEFKKAFEQEIAAEPTPVVEEEPLVEEPKAEEEPVLEPVEEPIAEAVLVEPAIEPSIEPLVEHTIEPSVEPLAEPLPDALPELSEDSLPPIDDTVLPGIEIDKSDVIKQIAEEAKQMDEDAKKADKTDKPAGKGKKKSGKKSKKGKKDNKEKEEVEPEPEEKKDEEPTLKSDDPVNHPDVYDFNNESLNIGSFINSMSNYNAVAELEEQKALGKTEEEEPKEEVDETPTEDEVRFESNFDYNAELEKGSITENDEIYALYELLKATRDYGDEQDEDKDSKKDEKDKK